MNKFIYIFPILICNFLNAQEAKHIQLLSHVNIPEHASSIWGNTIQDHEIAILGTSEGVRIYTLDNPAQPVELLFIKCSSSPWRELKSYGNYVYVVTEGGDGLLIINLSNLNDIKYKFLSSCYAANGDTIPLNSSHTIFIDEKGFIYLAGSSNGGYGACILDAGSNPENPVFVFNMVDTYFHEVYVVDDIMYAAELFNGVVAIYDIKDRQHPVRLNDQKTAYDFTHSAWLEEKRKVLYTADEVAGALVESFDVSSPQKIKLLDQYRTSNKDVNKIIPHNVFHRAPYLFISYYTEGVKILDTRDPENLIEVGNYDTYPELDFGFHGCWSVYPFFKSGLFILSDIEHGMFVLKFDNNTAKYLLGHVYDKITQQNISNSEITLANNSTITTDYSNLNGAYKTGLSEEGLTNITVVKKGYKTLKTSIVLYQDSSITMDFYMEPLAKHNVEINVADVKNQEVLSNVQLKLWNADFTYDAITDEHGNAKIENVYEGEYELAAGLWSYQDKSIGIQQVNTDQQFSVRLKKGYHDDFVFDHGWKQEQSDNRVNFIRSDFTEFEHAFTNYPSADIPNDIGNTCYYTNNFDKIYEEYRLHDHLYLISPQMDFTGFDEARLSYYPWSYGGGNGAIKECFLRIGNDTIPLEQIYENLSGKFNKQSNFDIDLRNKDKSKISFYVHLYNNPDSLPFGNSLRAALDGFDMHGTIVSKTNFNAASQTIQILPNPANNDISIQYDGNSESAFEILNLTGLPVYSGLLKADKKTFVNIQHFEPGMYFIHIINSPAASSFLKL